MRASALRVPIALLNVAASAVLILLALRDGALLPALPAVAVSLCSIVYLLIERGEDTARSVIDREEPGAREWMHFGGIVLMVLSGAGLSTPVIVRMIGPEPLPIPHRFIKAVALTIIVIVVATFDRRALISALGYIAVVALGQVVVRTHHPLEVIGYCMAGLAGFAMIRRSRTVVSTAPKRNPFNGFTLWTLRAPLAVLNIAIAAVVLILAGREANILALLLTTGIVGCWMYYFMDQWRNNRVEPDEYEYVSAEGIFGFGLARSRVMPWSEIKRLVVIWGKPRYLPFQPVSVFVEGPNKSAYIPIQEFGASRPVHEVLHEWCGPEKVSDHKDPYLGAPKGDPAGGVPRIAGVLLVGLAAGLLTAPLAGPGLVAQRVTGVSTGCATAILLLAHDRVNETSALAFIALAATGHIVAGGWGGLAVAGLCAVALCGLGLLRRAQAIATRGAV